MENKKFSKALWLADALHDKELGIITQQDIDNACDTWVDAIDGKTVAELRAENKADYVRENWLI